MSLRKLPEVRACQKAEALCFEPPEENVEAFNAAVVSAETDESTISIYGQIGWVAIGVGAVVLLVSPIVKRWMHLDTLEDDDVGDDLVGGGELGEPQAAGVHPEVRS